MDGEVIEIENLSNHEDDQENDHEPQAACNETTVRNQEISEVANTNAQQTAAIPLISDPAQINDGVHPMVRPTRSSCEPEVVSRPAAENQRREGAICTSETQRRASGTQDTPVTTELPQRQPQAQSSQSERETRSCLEEQREPEQPPPPTYTSLFPARGNHQSSPHTDIMPGRYYPSCNSQHSGLMASSTPLPIRHSTAQPHAQCLRYGHHCSNCYPTPTSYYPHTSRHPPHEHYTSIVPLPGSVGHCTEAVCNHVSSQIAVRKSIRHVLVCVMCVCVNSTAAS